MERLMRYCTHDLIVHFHLPVRNISMNRLAKVLQYTAERYGICHVSCNARIDMCMLIQPGWMVTPASKGEIYASRDLRQLSVRHKTPAHRCPLATLRIGMGFRSRADFAEAPLMSMGRWGVVFKEGEDLALSFDGAAVCLPNH